jgi:DNA-binding LytR/AlgR family response regulator
MVLMICTAEIGTLICRCSDCFDYLVKRITPERFLKSVNRAKEVFDYKQLAGKDEQDNFFFIKCNYGYEKINYNEILFIEASQNYCLIYATNAKLMTPTSMRSLEEQLPAGKFLRVQKSYIVAIDKIQSLAGNEIVIEKHKIPVSKNYKDELMVIIDKNLIKK